MTRIASGDEALEVAAKLAAELDAEAATRDANRRLPHEQLQALKSSGLLAITVPRRYGGIAASATVLAEVFRLLAHADPSLAQIPHSHFVFLEALRLHGSDDQKSYFYDRVREGALFANAQSERGPREPVDRRRLQRRRILVVEGLACPDEPALPSGARRTSASMADC
jgi:alkylation response protein AidB-like acyl-CoA dehydrogenase